MMMIVTLLAVLGMVVCLTLLFSVRAKTALSVVGIGVFLILAQLGSDAPRKASSQTEARFSQAATPYRVQPYVGQSSSASRRAAERARYAELGDKSFPSLSELREFLILDGRFGVEEGEWSASDFEERSILAKSISDGDRHSVPAR